MISRFLWVSIFFSMSCFANAGDVKVVKVLETPAEFKLPSKIWDLLLPRVAPTTTTAANDEKVTLFFAPLKVRLREKNLGVLTHPEIEFQLPPGGGSIDLADWMGSQTGTFYVQFIEPDRAQSLDQAFYLSNAKKRKVGDVIVGSGCKKFVDVQSALFTGLYQTSGVPVNTTRSFHVSTLAGHFIFSRFRGDQFHVTQVEFKDSKNTELQCSN